MISIRPPCSTTNNLPLPSFGCSTSSGFVNPVATDTRSKVAFGVGVGVGVGVGLELYPPLHPLCPVRSSSMPKTWTKSLRVDLSSQSLTFSPPDNGFHLAPAHSRGLPAFCLPCRNSPNVSPLCHPNVTQRQIFQGLRPLRAFAQE